MIPQLYNKTGNIKLGDLTNTIECLVEEERNGLFELSLVYPTTDTLFNSLEEENIIVVNANDTLLNQKFRIYMTRKLMGNRVEIYARHISFDLAYDYIDNIDLQNASCEYVLNTIFRNSQFSSSYRGYSDIINAQNYKISMVNIIEALGGKEGSIIDTFGTGAEILRDNTNIHVLNKRGHDNLVSVEYRKNIIGFELEEDTTDLVTRILPYATYNNEGNNESIIKANFVDSPLINNYSHPYIRHIDYTDRFKEGETITKAKLIAFAEKEFRDNKKDLPKLNYKIEFEPLSRCVGFEGIEDKISLCDIVTIKDTRYDIDTKSKVIKIVYDVLREKYESMELGEPRTTLGEIVNNGGSGEDGKPGPPGPAGPPGPPGADGNVGDFPNSLPKTPVLITKLHGFASIELSWTYEDKPYYSYELYASKTKDFKPNTFDLIHAGQTSSYSFTVLPGETWYFKVCAINSHGNRTQFSNQEVVTTVKEDDFENYFTTVAIENAIINTLSATTVEAKFIRGHYIDAKNLSVTDGNGKRTMDVDSYGNINLNVATLQILSNSVATDKNVATAIDEQSKKDKEVLRGEINTVQSNVDDVKNNILPALEDGILTDAEKQAMEKNLNILATQRATIDAQYESIISNTNLNESDIEEIYMPYSGYTTKWKDLMVLIEELLLKDEISQADRLNVDKAFETHNDYLSLYITAYEYLIDVIGDKKKQEAIKHTNTSISTLNGKIELKVSKDDIVNSINMSTEGIKIDANKLNITGFVTFNDLSDSTSKTQIHGGNIITDTIDVTKIKANTPTNKTISKITDEINSNGSFISTILTNSNVVTDYITVSDLTRDKLVYITYDYSYYYKGQTEGAYSQALVTGIGLEVYDSNNNYLGLYKPYSTTLNATCAGNVTINVGALNDFFTFKNWNKVKIFLFNNNATSNTTYLNVRQLDIYTDFDLKKCLDKDKGVFTNNILMKNNVAAIKMTPERIRLEAGAGNNALSLYPAIMKTNDGSVYPLDTSKSGSYCGVIKSDWLRIHGKGIYLTATNYVNIYNERLFTGSPATDEISLFSSENVKALSIIDKYDTNINGGLIKPKYSMDVYNKLNLEEDSVVYNDNIVSQYGNDMLSYDTNKLLALLMQSVKELKEEVEYLKSK